MKLGDKVKFLRNKNDISLRRLSEITGLSKTTLGDLETGAKNPSLETVEKVAKAFGLTSSQLLHEINSPEDLVSAAKDSSSELLAGLSKSGNLINALYRAKDAPKETMDQMAVFLDTLLKTSGYLGEDGSKKD